ncbi:hypothetical protein V3C99_005293 [Haemonchus contortus]
MMYWFLLLLIPVALIVIAVTIYFCYRSSSTEKTTHVKSESDSVAVESRVWSPVKRESNRKGGTESVEETPRKLRGLSSVEGSQVDQLRSHRDDTPKSQETTSKSPILHTCKDRSQGSEMALDETMGSSLMEHATQENELKSPAAKSKQQSAQFATNPLRSAETIEPPGKGVKHETKKEAAQQKPFSPMVATTQTMSVTPTTLTGTGSSATSSGFKNPYASSSQTSFPNAARSTTNVLMSEDAGKTPPMPRSPRSGSFESMFTGEKKSTKKHSGKVGV